MHHKNLIKEIDRITAHYYRSNIGAKKPFDPACGYIYDGAMDHIVKKHSFKKGNKKK